MEELHDKEKEYKKLALPAIFVAAILIIGLALVLMHGKGAASCSHKITQNLRYSCYLGYAEQNGNASICTMMNGYEEAECIDTIAVQTGNIATCRLINGSAMNACISGMGISTNNITACEQAGNQSCVFEVAKDGNFSNAQYCSLMNESNGDICKTVYWFRTAEQSQSSAPCKNIPSNASLSDLAYFEAANQSFQYLSLSAYYNITARDLCYIKIAALSKNESICGMLQGNASKICEANFQVNKTGNATINISTGNPEELCKGMSGTEKENCIGSIYAYRAISTGNVSICLDNNLYNMTDICIFSVAQKWKNESDCAYIKSQMLYSECYGLFNTT